MQATPEYIVKKLCSHKYATYIVGGAVRDLFLGNEPNDEDIVTKATPEEVIDIFKDHNIKTVGASFKVVLVDGIEVATFRTERCFGLNDKNIEVKVAETILEDLSRRDFTINSVAYCLHTGDIIDPFNGIEDLNNKIVKFVGDAEKRIFEDPNRIIRACRFLALINGKFDEKTKNALTNFSHLISEFVAPERIRLEILKAMKIKKASLFFQALYDIHALQYILPSLENCFAYDCHGRHHIESVIDHSFMVGDYLPSRNPLLKLTGYLHDVGKPISCVWNKMTQDVKFLGHDKSGELCLKCELKSLTFSNEEINYITGLTRFHMRNFKTPKAIRKTLKRLTEKNINWKDLYQLKLADSHGNLLKNGYPKEKIKNQTISIIQEINRKPMNKFNDLNINGFDIMNITGLGPGKDIGYIKDYIMENVLEDPDLNTRDNLINLLNNLPTIEQIKEFLNEKSSE